MAFETLLAHFQEKAAHAPALGKTLKFDFGDNHLFVDGTSGTNVVTAENRDADCTIAVSLEDIIGMVEGTVNPMAAFMGGRLKVHGDMGVAMKLQSLFKG